MQGPETVSKGTAPEELSTKMMEKAGGQTGCGNNCPQNRCQAAE